MRAMIHLAKAYKKNELVSLKEISDKELIPFNFLEKIIVQLQKAKLVRGKKGVGGGYILAKSINKITAKDIVGVLEETTPVDCSFCFKKAKCASKNVWLRVDLAIEKALKSVKLSDLIK